MFASYPPYAQMIAQTNTNYQTAISYYAQKEEAFRTALAKNSQDIYAQYITMLDQEAKNFNLYVLERAKEVIEKGKYTKADQKKDGHYSVYIDELFSKRNRGKDKTAWINMAAAGMTFEKFMYKRAMSAEQAARVAALPERAANHVYTQWLNTHKEFAATTGVKTFGRSDLAFGTTVTDDTKTELSNWIDLETTPPEGVTTGEFLLNAVAQEGVEQTVYGFQLKTYKEGSDDKRWQESKVLADQITSLMQLAAKTSKRTWSSNYAVNYPSYVLSKYLLNIINPINVATITPSGLEYTTDMLSKYRFYMEVTWDEPAKPSPTDNPSRGGVVEVYPRIANKTVLMRAVGASGWKGLLTRGNLRTSVSYHKEVKVASIYNA